MYLLYGVAQRWVPLNSRVVAILWDAVEDAVEDADSRPPVAPDLVTFRTVVSSTTRDGFLSFRLRLGASAPVWPWWVGGRDRVQILAWMEGGPPLYTCMSTKHLKI